jgi:hypothetical protein
VNGDFYIAKPRSSGRTNRLLSFDTTRTAQKKKQLLGDTQSQGQQGNLIILLTKNWSGYTDRQQGDHVRFISLKK